MERFSVIYIQPNKPSAIGLHLSKCFDLVTVSSVSRAAESVHSDSKVVVLDLQDQTEPNLDVCKTVAQYEPLADLPLLVLFSGDDHSFKVQAFELGCSDIIGADVEPEEVCARINRSIYHRIANEQLQSRLATANSTAFSVMADNSDLGANMQFLLGGNSCENLDQLGLLFFKAAAHYGLSCSLQMRSSFGTKNMEANGMSRDLESELMSQLHGAGRYIDFGRRSLVNYGRVSLLVRNMPEEGTPRYGAIKDNTFVLVQGMDARIKALDEHQRLMEERQALHKLSSDVKEVMGTIDSAYQEVMKEIVDKVEDMAEAIQARIPSLALSEEQEQFFEDVSMHCVKDTNRVFNQGLRVDQCFQKLCDDVDHALAQVDMVDDETDETEPQALEGDASVMLF